MVSSQLVGSSGPNSHWTGYGPTTQTYGGLLHLWDYDDDDPPATNGTIFPDPPLEGYALLLVSPL